MSAGKNFGQVEKVLMPFTNTFHLFDEPSYFFYHQLYILFQSWLLSHPMLELQINFQFYKSFKQNSLKLIIQIIFIVHMKTLLEMSFQSQNKYVTKHCEGFLMSLFLSIVTLCVKRFYVLLDNSYEQVHMYINYIKELF